MENFFFFGCLFCEGMFSYVHLCLAVQVFKRLKTLWKQMEINDFLRRFLGSQPLYV
jgi:hypothetical protein